jgi:glycerophosphoryl diester phosphodiesterase
MLTMISRPTIFAHRGASAYAPENTLAAFELAVRQGADGIELDAKLTVDGQVVVIHDQKVDRTTEGSGWVRDMPLAEIKRLDAGSHFDCAFRGEPIPTLNEVFEAVGHLTFINVELTNYASLTDDLPERVATLVKKHRLQKRVLFSSFNPLALIRVRRKLPETPVGLLALPGFPGAWARSWPGEWLNYQALNAETRDVSAKLVNRLHHRGKRIYVYTVNQMEAMHHLFDLGVDGLITDDPVLARQVLPREEY